MTKRKILVMVISEILVLLACAYWDYGIVTGLPYLHLAGSYASILVPYCIIPTICAALIVPLLGMCNKEPHLFQGEE